MNPQLIESLAADITNRIYNLHQLRANLHTLPALQGASWIDSADDPILRCSTSQAAYCTENARELAGHNWHLVYFYAHTGSDDGTIARFTRPGCPVDIVLHIHGPEASQALAAELAAQLVESAPMIAAALGTDLTLKITAQAEA